MFFSDANSLAHFRNSHHFVQRELTKDSSWRAIPRREHTQHTWTDGSSRTGAACASRK